MRAYSRGARPGAEDVHLGVLVAQHQRGATEVQFRMAQPARRGLGQAEQLARAEGFLIEADRRGAIGDVQVGKEFVDHVGHLLGLQVQHHCRPGGPQCLEGN